MREARRGTGDAGRATGDEGRRTREAADDARPSDGSASRRDFLTAGAAALAGLAVPLPAARVPLPTSRVPRPASRPIKQSAARWAYDKIPLPEFVKAAKRIGLAGVDLLQPNEWDVARDNGLVCSMGYPADRRDFLSTGFNDRANHALLLGELERTIPMAAQHGVPNVITMFGNRAGKSDAAGIDASIEGLSKIKPLAEQHGVTVCVELLNSKVDHKDYQGDHTAFGVEVMKGVGSPRVKLLYDIYHMQIMEGDVIRTIRDNIAYIGHFHTGGVPGRHELDDRQELNWRAIANAIADTAYTGFVAHEFVPTGDPLTSLKSAYQVFAV
jgi:hydroxypyruvate isomerase